MRISVIHATSNLREYRCINVISESMWGKLRMEYELFTIQYVFSEAVFLMMPLVSWTSIIIAIITFLGTILNLLNISFDSILIVFLQSKLASKII